MYIFSQTRLSFIGFASLLLLFFGLTPPQAESRQNSSNPPAYRSTVSEVRLLFFATDKYNRPVADLDQSDFAVVDNDHIVRRFRSFSRATPHRLDMVVLLDLSESALPSLSQEVATIVRLISQWPWNSEDSLSLVAFSGMTAKFICAIDCQRRFTPEFITPAGEGGATPLYDALQFSAAWLSRRQQGDVWPLIILLSDGQDNISKASFREAMETTWASEAQIYAIDIGVSGRPTSGTAILQKLAADSGGRYFKMAETDDSLFDSIIADLRRARVVTYLPPDFSPGFHSVRILPARDLNLRFRSRQGYYRDSIDSR